MVRLDDGVVRDVDSGLVMLSASLVPSYNLSVTVLVPSSGVRLYSSIKEGLRDTVGGPTGCGMGVRMSGTLTRMAGPASVLVLCDGAKCLGSTAFGFRGQIPILANAATIVNVFIACLRAS
jgi:hypothetical protein